MATAVSSCTLILAWLMLFRLGSLTGGLSANEMSLLVHSNSWHNLIHNPFDLPLTALQWLTLTLASHPGHTIARVPSVVFGILSLWAFTYILRRWYGLRTAALGTVLFVFSGWFLHASRLASVDILYIFGLLSVIVLHILLERAKNHWQALIIFAATAVLLYIPGFIWLLAIMYFWQWRNVARTWRLLPSWWGPLTLSLLVLAIVSLLGHALWRTHALIRPWLGLPAHFASIITILHHLVNVFSYLVVRGPHTPQIWLPGLPILDIFTIAMSGLGIYFYARHWRAPRARLLVSLLAIGAVLIAVGGPLSESLIIPIIFILAAAGVAYLLHEWLQVFPFNPLARGIGIGVLGVAIALVTLYNLREYYVAWPHNPETVATFKDRF